MQEATNQRYESVSGVYSSVVIIPRPWLYFATWSSLGERVRLRKVYTPNVQVTEAVPFPEPLRVWFPIIGILIAWFSAAGALQLLPLHLQKIPFVLVLAIVVAPFAGVVMMRRLRGSSKHILLGLMLAWLWLLIPASCEVVRKSGYVGLIMLWLPLLNLIVAIAATIRLTQRAPWRTTILKTFALGMLLGLAFYGVEFDAYAVSRLSPIPLQAALFQIDKCALRFAAEHPADGFATALKQLGPRGSNCTSEELVGGKYAGFTFEYSRHANKNMTNGFVVFARAPRFGGWLSESPHYYSDERGLIFWTHPGALEENPVQTKERLWNEGLTTPYVFWDVRACVRYLYRDWATPSIEKYVSDACLKKYNWIDGQPNPINGNQFLYDYKPRLDSTGLLTGFTLEARPREYGVSAIRSYLFVVAALPLPPNGPPGSYVVHATSEDRPATEADPLALECEIGGRDCGLPAEFNN